MPSVETHFNKWGRKYPSVTIKTGKEVQDEKK